ncbi:hypothetical protein PROFUN_01165 [Planoprotostelium fungivorum]|uniref:Uncharacterized protein n=1 Tax=Planoprotostelium fungivorum TaxID=1890364 RepID=A0A2P6NCJ3_9EUKA|nr:hypothetical protein PROFUN_16170 [Planoprotostelium fungivorum]PRP81658.1 hypothetical protein PROFUN_01165 [Planoprotostelium fungivorum]
MALPILITSVTNEERLKYEQELSHRSKDYSPQDSDNKEFPCSMDNMGGVNAVKKYFNKLLKDLQDKLRQQPSSQTCTGISTSIATFNLLRSANQPPDKRLCKTTDQLSSEKAKDLIDAILTGVQWGVFIWILMSTFYENDALYSGSSSLQ